MRSSINSIFFITLFFCIYSPPIKAESVSACSDQAKKNPIYEAFNNCDKARAVTSVTEFQNFLTALEQTGHCALLTEPGRENSSLLNNLCADLNGFVCGQKKGLLLNSKCQFTYLDPKEITKTGEYLDIQCKYENKEKEIINSHLNDCPAGISTEDCRLSIALNNKQEILAAERDTAYTPARVARITNAFKRVQKKYLERIAASSLITKDQKKKIYKLVERTTIDLPPKNTECANTSPTGPESGIYFQNSVVHICIGAMATLDRENDLDLFHTMGHELSHAIDPCVLALNSPEKPEVGITAYSGLVQCIRGGTGADGCTNAVINCNTERGVAEACQADAESRDDVSIIDRNNYVKACVAESASYSACAMSGPDTEAFNHNDLSDYRKSGEPISQMGEAFAEYMGSEVVSDLVAEDSSSGKMSLKDREDSLVGLATTIAGLHGRCLSTNTVDVHPAPFLRINRLIMGSKSFRAALGCNNGPPQTPGANMKCQGL